MSNDPLISSLINQYCKNEGELKEKRRKEILDFGKLAAEDLIKSLKSEDFDLRKGAKELLEELDWKTFRNKEKILYLLYKRKLEEILELSFDIVPILLDELDHCDDIIKKDIIGVIGKTRDSRTVNSLFHNLRNNNEEIIKKTMKSLIECASKNTPEFLERELEKEEDPIIRGYLNRLIVQIERKIPRFSENDLVLSRNENTIGELSNSGSLKFEKNDFSNITFERDRNIVEFYQNGRSGYEIAEELSISALTVYNVLKKYNIPRRSAKAYKQNTKEIILDLFQQGYSPKAISEETGYHLSTITNLLLREKLIFSRREKNIMYIANYLENKKKGIEIKEIEKKLNLSENKLRRIILNSGIKISNISDEEIPPNLSKIVYDTLKGAGLDEVTVKFGYEKSFLKNILEKFGVIKRENFYEGIDLTEDSDHLYKEEETVQMVDFSEIPQLQDKEKILELSLKEREVYDLITMHSSISLKDLIKESQIHVKTLRGVLQKLIDYNLIKKTVDITDTRSIIYSIKKEEDNQTMHFEKTSYDQDNKIDKFSLKKLSNFEYLDKVIVKEFDSYTKLLCFISNANIINFNVTNSSDDDELRLYMHNQDVKNAKTKINAILKKKSSNPIYFLKRNDAIIEFQPLSYHSGLF